MLFCFIILSLLDSYFKILEILNVFNNFVKNCV